MDEATTTYEEAPERLPYYSRRPPARIEVEPERRQRIKLWMAWCLMIAAIVVDLVELIGGYISFEIIASGVGIAAAAAFGFWFNILQVPYSGNTKRFVVSIVMNMGEVIPGLDAMPFWFLWSVGMLLIITLTRMEDRGEEPTILGALRRITVWTSPTALISVPLQKRRDVQRRHRQLKERQREAVEIAENPDRIAEIKQKYALRKQKFKMKELGRLEKTEHSFFKIGKEGVSLREGKTREEAKEAFGQLAQEKKGNILDLKNFDLKRPA